MFLSMYVKLLFIIPSLWLALFVGLLKWIWNLNCSSNIVIPRSFSSVDWVLIFPPIWYLALLGELKCTCLHLDLLKINIQSFDHYISLPISPCIFLSSFVLITVAYNFVSSAKSLATFCTMSGKSFMYIVNSMGPWTLHWGIPLVTSVHFELDPLSTTFCLRSNKKFLIHSMIFPDIP